MEISGVQAGEDVKVIEDQQDGEVVYWSNEDGWVDRASATLFTPAEAATLRLPMGNAPFWKVGSQ